MPEYRSDEWQAIKGEFYLPLTERHMVDLWISCTETVQVLGVLDGEKRLLKSGKEFRFRGQVKGFASLEVTSNAPFGLKVRHVPLQVGEYNSGERSPVVSLPEPSNLLLKMRQMQREHHVQSRMPVLDPDDFGTFGRYEVEDDQECLFEEEAYEKRLKEAKAKRDKKAAQEKAAQEQGTGPKPNKEPKEPAAAGAETGEKGATTPSPTQVAPEGKHAAE